jgi:hypothetical protein
MTGTAVKKGSHLRKSIQSSIGRLIHGTERRYALGYMLFLVTRITDDNSLSVSATLQERATFSTRDSN